MFGSPHMVVTADSGEKFNFFGSDRFEQMAMVIGKPYLGAVPKEEKVAS